MRETAVRLVGQVEEGAYANLALEGQLRRVAWSAADRALLTELVNGTVRMKKHLDWVLSLFLNRPASRLHPWVRDTLRVAAYQLLFLERIPAYAAVDEAVAMTRRLGPRLAGLVNGVLRALARDRQRVVFPDRRQDPVAYLSTFYSHPEWLVVRWLQRYGSEKTEELLAFDNRAADLCLRVNRLRVERDALLTALRGEGCECEASPLVPWAVRVHSLPRGPGQLEAFARGWCYVQDEGAMLVAPALSPRPGEVVYDLAAGVGGKTTHLAELMGNCGTVRAIESQPARLEQLRVACARLGVTIVEALAADVREGLPPGWQAGDGAVLDAPCSGLGVLRRRADLRWKRREQDIPQLSSLQRELLSAAAGMVRPGGVLVYSTCTLEPEENEEAVRWLLETDRRFRLEDLREPLGFFPFQDQDEGAAAAGFVTLFPPRYGTDGMFIARMRRVGA
ncbi:MAG: 16S rRNA (cytosine(967)-C(5))-methyltransferase RsmB [Syntrophomonadaceae bacterium]|nr:16S rRNA (cytosine(967)-C(5))-methyltransferase RsmB [Syntrophomonadaceae bacterium]